MSFTYDNTLGTDISKVRLRLADTDSTAYAFEDEEITATLTEEGSVLNATIFLIKVLITDAARRTKKFSVEGFSLDDTAQVAALQGMLTLYGGDQPTFSTVDPARLPMDAGFTEVT